MAEIIGTCLCGACGWRFEGAPDRATACNCTACRRYGALWIYGWLDHGVVLTGPMQPFARGERGLEFLRCTDCGCVMAWRGVRPREDGRRRAAVNVRMAEAEAVAHIAIRHFDGYGAFEEMPGEGRTVADYWV